MTKRIFLAATAILLIKSASIAQVQTPPTSHAPIRTEEIITGSKQHIERGEACLASGDVECARREFDTAVDQFLDSGVDLRSDERLLASWRETIERINRRELSTLAAGKQLWKSQDFEGRPPAESVAETVAESNGPLTTEVFQTRFAELRMRFEEKYGREITLTGADHEEHRRLYGRGSAYDIRVRDLTREQVAFIVTTGSELGLRIKDFSTWESVAAHNTRTRMLGRPLDTLATGVHLHIDRMVSLKKSAFVAIAVTKSRPRQTRNTKGAKGR